MGGAIAVVDGAGADWVSAGMAVTSWSNWPAGDRARGMEDGATQRARRRKMQGLAAA